MNMLGDMNKYTQYQVANSLPIAAANEGGLAGIGAGLGAGFTMAQTMANRASTRPANRRRVRILDRCLAVRFRMAPAPGAGAPGGAPAASGDTKFCSNCGSKIQRAAKFCPECGTGQA